MNIDLTTLVRELVEAEKQKSRKLAEPILAQNFIAITRARGAEQGRDDLLQEIETPRKEWHRTVEEIAPPLISGDIGVVRSIVATAEKATPEVTVGRFRNIHVFENQQGEWLCVAWQVTELKEGS